MIPAWSLVTLRDTGDAYILGCLANKWIDFLNKPYNTL